MARDPLEKETDVFNQMNQTVAFANQRLKDAVSSFKSNKKASPVKAVVKKKASVGAMPKVAQKKAPAVPGGSGPYKGNAAPGGSMRAGAARTGGTMRPNGTVAKAAAAKPAVKKPDYSNESNASYMLRSLLSGKKLGYYAVRDKTNAAAAPQPKASVRTSAGIAGKSAKSVNQLFK